MPKKARVSWADSSRVGDDASSRSANTVSSRLVAMVRKTESHVNRTGSSGSPGRGASTPALLDGTGDGEDGQVHRDKEAAHHAAEEHHQQRLDHRREAGDGRVHLVVIEVGDLVE